MSIIGLLKLNKGFLLSLGSLKAILVKVSQNFIKSHLKFCFVSEILVHSLWHVCMIYSYGTIPVGIGLYEKGFLQLDFSCKSSA